MPEQDYITLNEIRRLIHSVHRVVTKAHGENETVDDAFVGLLEKVDEKQQGDHLIKSDLRHLLGQLV